MVYYLEMRIYGRSHRRQEPNIPMAPMADIVFLLLIFFMLSSTFVVQPGIDIELPKAAKVDVTPKEKINITVDAIGNFFVNEQQVKTSDLEKVLGSFLARSRDKVVTVRADAKARHERVVLALDAARNAGAKKLAIAAERKYN